MPDNPFSQDGENLVDHEADSAESQEGPDVTEGFALPTPPEGSYQSPWSQEFAGNPFAYSPFNGIPPEDATDKEKLIKNLATVSVPFLRIPQNIALGWVIKRLWDWFMPASVPRISTAQALGLVTLFDLFQRQPELEETWDELTKQKSFKELFQPIANRYLFYFISYVAGRIIKRYLPN